MDRLIAAAAWHDEQSLDQALLVAESQAGNIDWDELNRWIQREGLDGDREIVRFRRVVGRYPA